MTASLRRLVDHVAQLLKESQTRIVFAESCTAGLVSAALARVAGISEFHCGSAVVYRPDTKTRWLGVSADLLKEVGAVCDPVARAMAAGVLERTPEAQLSASITGHLGPNAPADQDGLVFIALAARSATAVNVIQVFEHKLPAQILLDDERPETLREWRQYQAAELVLTHVRDELLSLTDSR